MGRRRFVRVTRRGEIRLDLSDHETDLVRSLVAQLQQLLAAGDDANLRRLEPPAHPDDDALQAEYAAMVHDQLLTSRFEALDTIERTIGTTTLSDDDLAAWMRGINDLRLVLGTRLDVSEDLTEIDADDPNAGAYLLYDWLGVVLTDIVDARAELL